MFDQFDRDFEKHSKGIRRMMLAAILSKLVIIGGLIWLAIYAINAFAK